MFLGWSINTKRNLNIMHRKIQMRWLLFARYAKYLNWRWPIKCLRARVASILSTSIRSNIFAVKWRITLRCMKISVARDCFFSSNRMRSERLNWTLCAFNATIIMKLWIVEYSFMFFCQQLQLKLISILFEFFGKTIRNWATFIECKWMEVIRILLESLNKNRRKKRKYVQVFLIRFIVFEKYVFNGFI